MVLTSNILKNNLTEEELSMVLEEFGGINLKESMITKYKETLD